MRALSEYLLKAFDLKPDCAYHCLDFFGSIAPDVHKSCYRDASTYRKTIEGEELELIHDDRVYTKWSSRADDPTRRSKREHKEDYEDYLKCNKILPSRV